MWRYSMRDVPTLHTYAEAEARFNAVVPMKSGPMKGFKPVGSRKNTHQRIERMAEDNSIRVTLGWAQSEPSAWVRWYSDGRIDAQVPGYSSSMGFIGKLLGVLIHQAKNKKWVCGVNAVRPDTGATIRGSFMFTRSDLLHFRQVEGSHRGDLLFLNPEWPQVRRTHRQRANAIRKQYAAFRAYARGVIGVNGGIGFKSEQLIALFGEAEKGRATNPPPLSTSQLDNIKVLVELIGWVGNNHREPPPENLFRAAVWVARTQLQQEHPTRWQWGGPRTTDNDPETLRKDMDFMTKGLDLLLFEHHAAEVYYMEPSYEGKIV